MMEDPIVEETRRWRAEYAAQFNHDLEAMFRDLKEKERQSGRPVVRLDRRKPNPAQGSDRKAG